MQRPNGITQQALTNVKTKWSSELKENPFWSDKENLKNIFDFLNDRTNLCTAEYLLRRQIQIACPKLFGKAAAEFTQEDCLDLRENGNVPWDDKFVEKLSGLLAAEKFPNIQSLNLDRRQWKKILTGESLCNRENAVKLIFALDMDEAVAEKFLIANGKNPFSTRNPFDYLCEFCRRGNFSYETAVKLLEDFETAREKLSDEYSPEPMEFATILLENETRRILANDKLTLEDKMVQIVKYMTEHAQEFVTKVERKNRRAEYPSGFSRQNNLNLKIFLRYLTKLYPAFFQWKATNEFDSYLFAENVKKTADGLPKNLEQLMQAMRDSQEIYFWEAEELEEAGLPTITKDEHGKSQLKEKQRYDAIPFNNVILLPLKNLSVTLRSNLRAEEHPDNAQDVDRGTILFLTYFFIYGCLRPQTRTDELSEELDNEIAAEENPQSNKLLYALKAVVNNVESLEYEENPFELYIDSLNEVLESFNCSKFYAPFVVDRFIVLCLATLRRDESETDLPEYLMNLLIEESYGLSKKMLEANNHGQ